MAKKRIILLGATGSIGRQTMDVVEEFPDRFELAALSCHGRWHGLAKSIAAHPDARLALSGFDGPAELPAGAKPPADMLFGPEGILRLIAETEADIVVNGIAGAPGLSPSIQALRCGKDLALANKESVVMGWDLLETAARESGKMILPVDSEHASLFQLLRAVRNAQELVITASGGAFRDRPLPSLAAARPDEAAAHPSWSMGRKISIDSATMANKGLEVIEASRLFHFPPSAVKVLIHPQSIVHALVRGGDGSLFANLSAPDMRLPILNALAYPESLPSPFGRLDLASQCLEFRAPDPERYPMLGLAYGALEQGYGATIAYNAADEAAVAAFEAGAIGYCDMARVVETVLARSWPRHPGNLDSVLACDGEARQAAGAVIKEIR